MVMILIQILLIVGLEEIQAGVGKIYMFSSGSDYQINCEVVNDYDQ